MSNIRFNAADCNEWLCFHGFVGNYSIADAPEEPGGELGEEVHLS